MLSSRALSKGSANLLGSAIFLAEQTYVDVISTAARAARRGPGLSLASIGGSLVCFVLPRTVGGSVNSLELLGLVRVAALVMTTALRTASPAIRTPRPGRSNPFAGAEADADASTSMPDCASARVEGLPFLGR